MIPALDRHHRLTALALAALGCALLLAGCDLMPGGQRTSTTVRVTEDPWFGPIVTDGSGMTLYKLETMDGDDECLRVDECTKTWPPLTAPGELARSKDLPGRVTTKVRPDRSVQVVYNGWALYRYVSDEAPGDTNGHRVTDEWGTWSVVEPDEEPPS